MSSVTGQPGMPVLILKEGASRSRGKEAQRSNINAAKIISEAVRSSLGPKGMDKMLVDGFGDVTITNDGRTILEKVDVEHPAAKMMVEVAKTQDDEVGDGTTTAVIVAGELLAKAQELLDKNVHPTVVIDGYRKAADKALEILEKIAISLNPKDTELLKKIAITSMASKIISNDSEQLSKTCVEAVLHVAQKVGNSYKVDLEDIMIEKKIGESISGTKLIQGIVLDKEIVHVGMPKRVEKTKIVLLDSALEVEKTEFDAKINIENPEQMEAFLKEEEKILREMVEKIAATGTKVVICQKGIDDMIQHFLVRKGIIAVKRVKKSDMEKLAKATGGRIVTSLEDMKKDYLGNAELVEERKIGEDKMIFVEGCQNPQSVAILIRGGTERILDEADRSIHDALCVIRDVVQEPKIVAGGGATEEVISKHLREYAESLPGREQLAVKKFSEAIEIIPITLGENAGLDSIDIISEIRSKHEESSMWTGINVLSGKVEDMKILGVYEPLSVKKQAIKSASEASTLILKIDDVIAAGKSSGPPMPSGGMPGGGYGGMPPGY
jgi:thermosome